MVGSQTWSEAIESGWQAGAQAAALSGHRLGDAAPPLDDDTSTAFVPAGTLLSDKPSDKAFIDFQNDVTVADVELAHREGYQSVEHLKRYTTLGMGTDQGKTSNLNGLGLMAAARGIDVDAVSHVVQYDLPNVPEAYVHRIGRTARAGADGSAVAFCSDDERNLLKDIEKVSRQRIPSFDRRNDRHLGAVTAAMPDPGGRPERADTRGGARGQNAPKRNRNHSSGGAGRSEGASSDKPAFKGPSRDSRGRGGGAGRGGGHGGGGRTGSASSSGGGSTGVWSNR